MRILLLCCLSLLVACQSRGVLPPPAPIASEGRDHAGLGVILDLRSGERITPQRLVERLARPSRVVVGEQHDNPDHHALQLWLSRELAARRPQGSVLLEMLKPNQQTRVDQVRAETRAGRPPLDAIRALAWQPGWDWAMYGALVRYQLRQPYPLLAANLDREEIMRIYQQRPALQGQASTAAAVQQRLQREGYPHRVVNASISGETTDGGLRRLPGLLSRHEPEIVVIELGGNDGLRGFPPQVIEQNLARMIELTQAAGARAVLVGMQIPPNYGQRYTRAFAELYPRLSDRYDAPLVPFFLEGIYDQPPLMQGDGIHPTAQAQPRLLDNVWPHLKPLVGVK